MSESAENEARQQPHGDGAGTDERPGATLVDMQIPADEPAVTRPSIRAAFAAPASGPAVSTATPTAPVPAKTSPAETSPAQRPMTGQPATGSVPGAGVPGTGGRPAEPLLRDTATLRTHWQRVQGSFVDDPQAAVGDAADLVEQTAQALVGALRQRQRELRQEWDRSPADGTRTGAAPGAVPDTEHLRMLMQRYRTLFNQLCRP